MRLFIAINFDDSTKEQIIGVQKQLRDFGRGNFSRPENLHLTLAFLGEITPNRVPAVRRAMDDTTILPMELTFDHMGRFSRGGDIWWLGLAENPKLLELQALLSRNLKNQGFTVESRRFSPHITLARQVRLKSEPDPKKLLGPFSAKVDTMSLMLSEHVGGKLTYTEQYSVSARE